MMSVAGGSSRTYGAMAGSGSRVMITGGLGLFLEPGGRPRGRLTDSMEAPSLSFLGSGSSESWNGWVVMACDGGGCWWWWNLENMFWGGGVLLSR